jgi:LuxR family maltose regulon positive regulatory protein
VTVPARPIDCAEGDAALAKGAWPEARDAFRATLANRESAEAWEGLGLAAWWLDEAETVFDARERAYRLFVDADDWVGASRVAVWIAWDCWAFRGEHAVANGWLQRARRHLDGRAEGDGHAWVESREAALALLDEGDPDRAYEHASQCIHAARAAGNIDLEMLGRALQGLALVASGAVVDGLARLDEVNAAVVAGDLHDLVAIGLACCYMISACERVRDYDRAVQWCTRLKAFSAKWGLRPLFAVCRTQYASICLWQGTWSEAEKELTAATEELAACRPAMSVDGVVRLAELRRRQGRLVEAASLFDQAERHPLAALGRAELAFDRGDMRTAADQGERCLRRLLSHNRTDRAVALELLVRAFVGAGNVDGARTALAELTAIARLAGTLPLRAAVALASGYVELASGQPDAARRQFEDAVDLYLECGAPYELGRARTELADALQRLGRPEEAAHEARRAVAVLSELRAELAVSRARAVLDALPAPKSARAAKPVTPQQKVGLSTREMEVLRLVADGLNNQVIGNRLFVSEHTVHRHVANIFNKLSVSSRAAAVAKAARHGIL